LFDLSFILDAGVLSNPKGLRRSPRNPIPKTPSPNRSSLAAPREPGLVSTTLEQALMRPCTPPRKPHPHSADSNTRNHHVNTNTNASLNTNADTDINAIVASVNSNSNLNNRSNLPASANIHVTPPRPNLKTKTPAQIQQQQFPLLESQMSSSPMRTPLSHRALHMTMSPSPAAADLGHYKRSLYPPYSPFCTPKRRKVSNSNSNPGSGSGGRRGGGSGGRGEVGAGGSSSSPLSLTAALIAGSSSPDYLNPLDPSARLADELSRLSGSVGKAVGSSSSSTAGGGGGIVERPSPSTPSSGFYGRQNLYSSPNMPSPRGWKYY